MTTAQPTNEPMTTAQPVNEPMTTAQPTSSSNNTEACHHCNYCHAFTSLL